MKKLFITFIVSIVLFNLIGCKDDPIKIGYVGSLTGNNSELGVNGMYGAILAVEDINNSGGIKGRNIELITKDDQGDKNIALQVDKEFVEEGSIAIIGHMTSDMAELTVPYINKEKILMISPTIAMDSLSDIDDYFIRLIPSNKEQAQTIAEAIIKQNIKKLVIIYTDYNIAFTEGITEFIKNKFEESNIEIEVLEDINLDRINDYKDIPKLVNIQQSDGVVILAPAAEVANLSQVFHILNIKKKIFMPAWSMTNDLIERGGPTVEGNYGVNYINYQSTSQEYLAFRDKYIKRFGNFPTFSSILTYESVMILADAMKEVPNFDSDILKNSILKKGQYNGLQNDITFNKSGDVKRDINLYQIKNGEFVKVDK